MGEEQKRSWTPLAVGAIGFALLAMLPLGAGQAVQGGLARLTSDSQSRAETALADAGHAWAQVKIGSDGVAQLVGAAPSSEAQAAALSVAQAALRDRTGLPGVVARWETQSEPTRAPSQTVAETVAAPKPPAPASPPPRPVVPDVVATATPTPAARQTGDAPRRAAKNTASAEDCARALRAQLRRTPIRFAPNATRPTRASRAGVAQLAAAARDCMAHRIVIAGHADRNGGLSQNQRLSEQRARAVVRALADAGLDPRALRAVGLGETRLLDRARSANADARNRRISITVVPR